MRVLPLVLFVTIAAMASVAWAAPDFQREVEPIFAEHCAECHGVDAAQRKSGLRLDLRESALAGGESGMPAVVPGDPDKSELVRRITAADPDELMPPPDFKRPLAAKEIETLKQWIRDGAKYESHWAFTAPVKANPPEAGVAHPIDAVVISRLKERGLMLSPAASPAALCRRLYLDLIGLPPSPQELAAFEQQGLEATVERLLA
ncbi:MAG: c-type cytochrome domain-containing protein, partial [Pirellulales bacterium]